MKAGLLLSERYALADNAFAELIVWRLPATRKGSLHSFKYRLAYVVDRVCVIRYDNEAGKGDHRHIGEREQAYDFTSPEKLLVDFWNDVDRWRP